MRFVAGACVALLCLSACAGSSDSSRTTVTTTVSADTTLAAADADPPGPAITIKGSDSFTAGGKAEAFSLTGAGACPTFSDRFCTTRTGAGGTFAIVSSGTTTRTNQVFCGNGAGSEYRVVATNIGTTLAGLTQVDSSAGAAVIVNLGVGGEAVPGEAVLVWQPAGSPCPEIHGLGQSAGIVTGGGPYTLTRPDDAKACVKLDGAEPVVTEGAC